MIHQMTTNDSKWQWIATSGKTSGTTGDNEWQQMAMGDNNWQRVTSSSHFGKFPFFQIREEPTTMHPKETL